MKNAENPIPPIIDNIELIMDSMEARDLIVKKQADAAKTVCTALVSSKKWEHASDFTRAFVMYLRATANILLKDNDAAVSDYAELLKYEPENVNARLMQAESLMNKGQNSEAKEAFDKVLELSDKNNSSMYVNLSAVCLRMQDYTGALTSAQNALEIDGRSLPALQNAALATIGLGRAEDVFAYVKQIQKIDPNPGLGHYLSGKANSQLEKHREAIADYTKAIDSGFLLKGTIYNARAAAHSFLNNDVETVADCDRTLKLKPDDLVALRLKGLTLLRLGRGEEAAKVFNQEVILNSEPKAKAAAHLSLSIHFLKINDVETALKECDEVLKLDEENANARNNRAWIFAHRGETFTAVSEIEKLEKADQLTANTLATRGFIYFLADRMQDAKDSLDGSLAKNPSIGEALFYRAIIYQREGDTKTAGELFKRAKAVHFKNPSFSVLTLPTDTPEDWEK